MSHVTIKKSPKLEIRIQSTVLRDESFVDVRQYYKAEDGEWKPTKKGIMIKPDEVDAVIAGIKKVRPTAVTKVADVGEDEVQIKFCIAASREDANFCKRHVYAVEDEARRKNAPAGYKLFKVRVQGGTITGTILLADRKAGTWLDVKRTKTVKAAQPKKGAKAA